MNNRNDANPLPLNSVYETVISYYKLSYGLVFILWDNAPKSGITAQPFNSGNHTPRSCRRVHLGIFADEGDYLSQGPPWRLLSSGLKPLPETPLDFFMRDGFIQVQFFQPIVYALAKVKLIHDVFQ
jgi:hypothetical protein